jgi:hypothetical protein
MWMIVSLSDTEIQASYLATMPRLSRMLKANILHLTHLGSWSL